MTKVRLTLFGAAIVALAVTLTALPPGRLSASFNDSDGDGSIDAAEIIAGSDPHDAANGPESGGGSLYLNLPLCTDGIDNDLDGLLDGADPGCTDTDGDFVDDPVEVKLGSDPNDCDSIPEDALVDAVLVSLGFVTFQCNDGLDNDLDGVIDDSDPGCAPVDLDDDGTADLEEKRYGSDANDPNSRPEDDRFDQSVCADGMDNDRDGLIDGEDSGCLPHPTETSTQAPPPGETPTGEQGTPGSTATATATATAPPALAGLPATGTGHSGNSNNIEALFVLAALFTVLAVPGVVVLQRRT